MASQSYLAKCVFPSSVLHTGRAWEARCTAAAGAGTENSTGGQASHKGRTSRAHDRLRRLQRSRLGLLCRLPWTHASSPPPPSHHQVRTEDTRWPVQRDKEATINMNISIYIIYFLTYLQSSQSLFKKK